MSYLSKDKGAFETSKSFSAKSFQTLEQSGLPCACCRLFREQSESQIAQLKDKAHQSFMQVLQIQQLHEEELTILREEWEEKQRLLCAEVEQLRTEKGRLGAEMALLERNAKRHSCDLGRELVIENIEAILCEQGEASYLDESQLIQFKDLITTRGGSDYVASLRREIYKDFKFVSSNKTQIEKLFILIRELKEENLALQQRVEEMARKVALADNQLKSYRNASDASAKEIKFLSDQIKRLGNDKLKLEKKMSEIERGGFSSPNNRPKLDPADNNLTSSKNQSPSLHRAILDHEKSIAFLQESKNNISELSECKREVNQLNYAKFMGPEEVDPPLDHNFKKRVDTLKARN